MQGHKTFMQVKNVSVKKFQELNFINIITRLLTFSGKNLISSPLIPTQ